MRCLVLAQPRTRGNLLCREICTAQNLQWLGEPYQQLTKLRPRSQLISCPDPYLIKLQTTDLLRLARPGHSLWAWQDWDQIYATYRRDRRAQLASLIVAETLGQWWVAGDSSPRPQPSLRYQADLQLVLAGQLRDELRIWQHTVALLGGKVQICAYEDSRASSTQMHCTGYDYREIFTNYWDIPWV